MMKAKLLLSVLTLAALLPLSTLADVWQDPETKVNYEYTVGESKAIVDYSTDVTGSITILSSFTVDGNTYSVTSIGGKAFYCCWGLTSITIPSTVTSIGSYAFYYCSSLTSVTIPSSVTSIGSYAFYDCDSLTSVTIPSSVTSIGSVAFGDCSGLTSIIVENGNPVYDSRSNCNAIIETESNTLIQGCMNTTIPSSVTSIGDNAFFFCDSLTSVTISSSVTSIGEMAFYSCSSLTSVTISSSVTSIGEMAFYSCSSLTSVTIPSSVTSIGNSAFSRCSGLTSIIVESGNPVYDSRSNCNAIIETESNTLIQGCMNTTIPSSVTSIGYLAFTDCSGLTSVTIPSSVTSIDGSFVSCNGLISIIVESGNPVYDSRDNCNAIIETESNTLIQGCMNTAIPSSVTSIGQDAFYNYSSLTSVTIPSSVTSIGARAFYGCIGLTSVSIPEGVTSIGYHAFNSCSGLTSVTIPSTVTSIGYNAFSYCSSLTSVITFIKEPFTINENVFQYYDKGYKFTSATLYVPKDTKQKYEATSAWNLFQNIVEIDVSDQPQGDVNGDQTVDVADIASVISVMADSVGGGPCQPVMPM